MDIAGFSALLTATLDGNDAIRGAAEAQLAAAKADPNSLLLLFIASLGEIPDADTRKIATVLCRRTVTELGVLKFRALPAAAVFMERIPVLLANEPNSVIRRQIADLAAEVARFAGGPGLSTWPTLLPAIQMMLNNPDPAVRCDALATIRKLAQTDHIEVRIDPTTSVADILTTNLLVPRAGDLFASLSHHLNSDPAPTVRAAAAVAVALFIGEIEDASIRVHFKPLLGPLFAALKTTLGGDEEIARAILESLVQLVGKHPSFLTESLEAAATAMLEIANAPTLEEGTRSFALEFLITLGEATPATFRKVPLLMNAICTLSMSFLAEMDHDADWEAVEEDLLADFCGSGDDSLISAGGGALDRIARAVKGKALWPVVEPLVLQYLSSPEWNRRAAGLFTIALVAEGCKKTLAPILKEILQKISVFADDPHPRVRHALGRALGQFAVDFADPSVADGEEAMAAAAHESRAGGGGSGTAGRGKAKSGLKSIQESSSTVVVPTLIRLLQNSLPSPRIITVSAAALINFCHPSYCTIANIKTYVRPLLETLFAVLKTSYPQVIPQETAMGAIGCVAMVIEAEFSEYYDIFMPIALDIVKNTGLTGPKGGSLRGKGFECISLICEGVGSELCSGHIAECYNVIATELRSMMQPDGTFALSIEADLYRLMMEAMIRFAGALGTEFSAVVPSFVPLLMSLASIPLEVAIIDGEDTSIAARDAVAGKETFAIAGRSGETSRRVALNTDNFLLKSIALETLGGIVETIAVDSPPMWPLLADITNIMLTCTGEKMSTLRTTALYCLPHLFLSAMADVTRPTFAQEMLGVILPALAGRIEKEPAVELLYVEVDMMSEILRLTHNSDDAQATAVALPPPSLEEITARTGPAPHTRTYITPDAATSLLPIFRSLLLEALIRRQKTVAEWASITERDEEDEDGLEQALQPETDLVTNIIDCVGYIIKSLKDAVVPLVASNFSPFIEDFIQKTDAPIINKPFRHGAICMVDDLVEHTDGGAALVDLLLNAIKPAVTDPDPSIRQASVYGIAILADRAPAKLRPHAAAVASFLQQLVTSPDARSDEYENATDNAVSALFRVSRAYSATGEVPADAIVGGVIAYLPLCADETEAKLLHGWLIEGMMNLDPLWVGAGNSRFGECLSALARVLHQDKINSDAAAAAAAEAEGDNDDDDDGDDELLTEESRSKAKALLAGISANPAARAAAVAVAGSLKPKFRKILVENGLVM